MRIRYALILSLACATGLPAAETQYDIVIYGGTSGGVAAAVQARRMGKSVVLIEPTRRLGGLTSGGLGATDIGNKAAIGGIAREFYQAVRKHYDDPASWKWQTPKQNADSGQTRTASGEEAMWTFEPSAALKIFDDWVRENRIEVVYGERLDRKAGVAMTRAIPWRIIVHPHGVRPDVSRSDVHRRHVRRRSDGGGQRQLCGRPRGERPIRRDAQRRADQASQVSPVRAGHRPVRRQRRSQQRPAAVHRPARPGRRGQRPIVASRRTAFACA